MIIGANEFQRPLILKAKELGYETHVFAWREGASGADDADRFYEISITEKERILEICRNLSPAGVVTAGSDLANITVQYLAEHLGLPGNSGECLLRTTNKYFMRKALRAGGLSVPWFQAVRPGERAEPPSYPVIVKPTDRSGSRAVTRVETEAELAEAVERAAGASFEGAAIVESCLPGREYSVETISFQGRHTCLAVTKKFTTGSPHYIEVGHLQPAPLESTLEKKVKETVFRALDALKVESGAGHSELRIDGEGNIHIIEIGSRMGGDCIGSDLVPLSTGCDFLKMIIDVAVGKAPETEKTGNRAAAVRFFMNRRDWTHYLGLKKRCSENIIRASGEFREDARITDSGSRPGFYILCGESREELEELLHEGPAEDPIQLFETPVQKLCWNDGENVFWIKRDDLLPFAFGGNKVRFAKKYAEDMRRKHCDAMVIYGNYHSNLCRILATLCKNLSIPCCMVHNREDLGEIGETENSRMIRRMGVREIPCGKRDIPRAVEEAMSGLREEGYRPYYIYGSALGKGNVSVPMEACEELYEEICRQETALGEAFDYIFLASSTNCTQSGLLAGSILRGDRRKIVGISVSRNEARGKTVMEENLREYFEKKGLVFPEEGLEKILFTDAYLEGGYGADSPGIARMIRTIYESDGIPLDMTYTGKAFYGMANYLKEQGIRGKRILFLHTGGTPLFFDFLKKESGEWER